MPPAEVGLQEFAWWNPLGLVAALQPERFVFAWGVRHEEGGDPLIPDSQFGPPMNLAHRPTEFFQQFAAGTRVFALVGFAAAAEACDRPTRVTGGGRTLLQ